MVDAALGRAVLSVIWPSAVQPWGEMLRAVGESTWVAFDAYLGFDRATIDRQWPKLHGLTNSARSVQEQPRSRRSGYWTFWRCSLRESQPRRVWTCGGGDDVEAAFALYEWNMTASAAVMHTTGMVEVVVRNATDRALQGPSVCDGPLRDCQPFHLCTGGRLGDEPLMLDVCVLGQSRDHLLPWRSFVLQFRAADDTCRRDRFLRRSRDSR